VPKGPIPDWCPLPESGWHKPPDLPKDGEWVVAFYETDDPDYQWGGVHLVGRDIEVEELDPTYDWWRPLGKLPPGIEEFQQMAKETLRKAGIE